MKLHQMSAVFFGGVAGATARWGLLEILPAVDQWPWHILLINISGSAALGIVVGLSSRATRKMLFLAVGTGFCGAFTTFSSFAVDIALFLKGEQYFNTVSLLAASIVGGLLVFQISKRSTKSRNVIL
ncbi:MAG: CrcB family protein [Actinomycetota bacterium]|nr:CrcB family protein [Actinomycetota bacterium]